MKESNFLTVIGATLGFTFSTVRQSLRSLREAGVTPGRRQGDLTLRSLTPVILALSAPTYASIPAHVETLSSLPLRSAADLPTTAGKFLNHLVNSLPASPVVGDLDLDDGWINFADDRVEIECLSLTGKRAVIRYGAIEGTSPPSPITRISLNGIRDLAVAIRNRT